MTKARDELRAALSHPNVQAFLRVIREGESSQNDFAYRMRYGGHGKSPVFFDDLSQHPKVFEPTARPGLNSSAAGAYQATWTTWREEQRKYGWPDFSRASQDEFAVARLIYRSALAAVKAGRFEEACRLCHAEWTSLPGGEEENAATPRARETYVRWGGTFAETKPASGETNPAPDETIRPSVEPALDTPDFNPNSLDTEHYDAPTQAQEVSAMPAPLIPIAVAAAQAFLPRLAELIPALGAALGSGSEVQKRNVAVATLVAKAVQDTVAAPTLQAAMETIEQDPQALARVREVVNELVPTLVEAGGGGIKGARDAAASQSGDWRKLVFSLPFAGLIAFVPLAWLVVIASVFKSPWLVEMDAQLRGTVIGFVMGTLAGSIVSYIYGSSMTKGPASPSPNNR